MPDLSNHPLLLPPVAFAIVMIAALALSLCLSRLSYRRKDRPAGLTKPYACGEDIPSHMMQPDYAQFFPFAFFFTILHVVALMATTVPAATAASMVMVCVYVVGAIIGLSVLYSR